MKPSDTPVVDEESCLDEDTQKICPQSRSIHFESTLPSVLTRSSETKISLRLPTPYPSKILFSSNEVDKSWAELSHSSPEKRACVQPDAKPLEDLFAISEERIFEEVHQSMIKMQSDEQLLKGVSVEQVRKIVSLIHQKINAALSNYIKQQIFCQGPTWLELPSTSADSPGQLLATASINLIDTRWQDSAEIMELSLNLATETTDKETDSVVKVALKTLEKFVDSSLKENKEAGQSESRARFNMSENFHFSKRDPKTMNEKNLEHKYQSITIVDVKSSNEYDEKAESFEMVKTVPKHPESLCDSLESSFGKFDNSLPLTPRNCFTAESQLQPDNVQEKLESAIPNIFKYVEDKLKVFFRSTEAQAVITPEKPKMKSPPLTGAVDKDMLDIKHMDLALCKKLSTNSDSPVSGISSESDRHSLHIQVSAGEVCPNFSEMLHISSEELLDLEKKEALVSAAGLVAVTIVESLVDSTSVETDECENRSHEKSNSHFNTFLHVMAEKMKHYLKRVETSVQVSSNDGNENTEISFGLQRQPSPKLSQDVLIKATLAVSDLLIPPSTHSHEDLLLAKQCQVDKTIKSASQQPELSEMVKTVAKNLKNIFDSVEHSGFDLFEVPCLGETQKSSSTADNLDPAVNHIFQDIKDKLHFFTSSEVPASSETILYPLSEDAGEVFQDLPPLTPSADVLLESDVEKETDIITTTEMVTVAILESVMDSTSKENCKDEDKSQSATKARFNTFLHVLADKIKHSSKGVQKTVDQEKKTGFENLPSTTSEDTRKECKSTSAETSQMSSEHNVLVAPQVQRLSLLTPSAVELDKEKDSYIVLAAEQVSVTTVESSVDSTTKDLPRHESKKHGAASVGSNTFLHACADPMKGPFKGVHTSVDQQRRAANLLCAPVEATVQVSSSGGGGITESSLSLAGQPSSELSRDILMKATLAVSDLLDPSCSHPQQDQLLSQKGQEVISAVTGRSTSQQAVVSGMVETVAKDLVNLFDSFEQFEFDMFGPCFEEISMCSSANNCELGSNNCQSCFEPVFGHIFQSVSDKKSQVYNSSLKEDISTYVRSNASDDLTEELIKPTSAEISSHLPSVGVVCIDETPSFLEKESLSGPSLYPKILPDPANHMADQSLVKSDLPCENEVSMDKTLSEASLFYQNFWLSLINKLTPRRLKPAVEVQQEAKSLLRNEDAAGPPPKHNWRRNQPDSMETEPDGNVCVGCQMVTSTPTHYIPSSSDIPATIYSSSYESVGTEDGGSHSTMSNTSTTPSSERSLSYTSSLSSSSLLSERTAWLKPGLDPTNVISRKRTNEVQATPGPSTGNSKVEEAVLETSAGTRDRSPRVRMVATELSTAVTSILCLMKRMLLVGEDPAKVEGDLKVLLSCGVLRPFRDSVVDRVNTFLLENAPDAELFLLCKETDKIELSRETFLELVYTVTEHTFEDMFKHLIITFLAPSSTLSPSETTDEIGFQTCSSACSKASKDIVSMFTRVVAQQVAETLSKDPIQCGQTELSSLSKVSDDPCQSAGLAPKNVLPPMPPSNHECLRATLTILVVRIITKIRSIKSVVILKKMAVNLTEQILKRCQDGSQLEKMEASLRDVNLMEITSNMKKALLKEFSTLEALRRAMTHKDSAFGETLVTLLMNALVSCEDGGKEHSLKPGEKVSYFSKLAQKRKMRNKVAPSPQQDPETMDCTASSYECQADIGEMSASPGCCVVSTRTQTQPFWRVYSFKCPDTSSHVESHNTN